MQITITPERALSNGISPSELAAVAQWHQERADLINQDVRKPPRKRRPLGDAEDVSRHEDIAYELHRVASRVEQMQRAAA